jgi:phage tail-like protein
LDEAGIPISSWLFLNAYPVKWLTAALDADANAVVIETMELAYQRMQTIRI